MHSSLLSLLFLSLLSPILASPIDPSDSFPSRTTENTLDPSLTLGAPGAANSLHCVSPRDHPDWGGPITYKDCYTALGDLSNRLGNQKWNWQLWSARYGTKPASGHPLQLPLGATRGSCTLLLRIGRDFGSDVIPYDDGGYVDATGWPTEGLASSLELLLPLQLDLIPGCVGGEGLPGWNPLAAHPPEYMQGPGFALVLPSTSRMAQRWGPGVAGELNHTSLGLLNHTSLGLVEIS
ncbi:hypothetical protein BDR22DRAFT_817878 [Usnea florida]